jgi:hypothetical protein
MSSIQNIDDSMPEKRSLYTDVELQQVFSTLTAQTDNRSNALIFLGTVNLAAVGIAFTTQKSGIMFLAAILAFGAVWVEFKGRSRAIILCERLLQLKQELATISSETSPWSRVFLTATDEEVMKYASVLRAKPSYQALPRMPIFRWTGIWGPVILGISEVLLSYILARYFQWGLF